MSLYIYYNSVNITWPKLFADKLKQISNIIVFSTDTKKIKEYTP